MKKKILFVMNNLHCGGAEKSLISLLETMDYNTYEVDLFLFQREGLFFSKIPKQVNLLNPPSEYNYFDMSIKKAVYECLKKGKIKIALNRLVAGFIFRTEKNNARCEQRVWKYISKSIKTIDETYDVAIGYLEKNPIYFCIEKVKAKKKIGFIHTDYEKLGMDPQIDLYYFGLLDNIVTVSEECASILEKRFPQYKKKITVMYNIVSPAIINKMSQEHVSIDSNEVKIISVGRLNYLKGFDLAIDACKRLIQKGYRINWLVIGEGDEREKLEKLIKEKNLEGIFILLGIKENPYPYIKSADIYVHTSRFEGKSIAIDEAKILSKPIITTNFDTAKDQITNEINGLIVEMDAKSIALGIERLITNDNLRKKIISRLSFEKLGTETEIEKLYRLMDVV